MKRSLPLFIGLLFSVPVISQNLSTSNNALKLQRSKLTGNYRSSSAPALSSTIIYSEDFGSGLPGTWTVTDNAGNGEVWVYTTTGSVSGGLLDTVGTTAENGYMMFDSDGGGQGNPENCDLQSPAINCTGQSQVYLTFRQWYWEFFTDTAYVGVSNDGVNWTYVYCPDTTLDNGEQGPNAEHIVLDISAIAANQATVYLKFHYEGNYDWWWFVDDVAVYVPDAVDMVAVSCKPLLDAGYTQVPISQVAYIPLHATVRNYGGSTVTGATALIDVIDNNTSAVVFTTGAPVPVLGPLATADITGQFTFYTSALSDYSTAVRVFAAGDVDTTNNKFVSPIGVVLSDSVFARDDGQHLGWVANGAGVGGIMGTNFTLNNSDVLTSVSIFLDSIMINRVNPNGTPIWLTIHDQNAAVEPTTTPIATTDTLMATPGFIVSSGAGGQWFTFNISGGPLWLNAGTYMIGVNEYDSAVYVGTSPGLYTPGTNWVTWSTIPSPPANNGWATIEAFVPPLTLMLRANFGAAANSIQENNPTSFNIYPNPATDIVTLSFTDATERIITVYSLDGKVVSSSVVTGNTVKLDCSAFAEGVYLIKSEDGVSAGTQKISIVR